MGNNLSKIYLSSPHMGGNEQSYVSEAFVSNWIAPLGPNVAEFENRLENYINNNKKIASLSSGTAALHLALVMLDVQPQDEVICQSMTFSASANPILYQKATPIFVDSEPITWNICPVALENAIKDRIQKGKKPKAVIAVHLYGMPFLIDAVVAVCNKYEIPLIEDAAEALGSSYKEQKCGTFGTFAALSFNGNKIITTSGGGALITENTEKKEETVFYATQSRDNAPHYQHSKVGYNYRMSNICAGIGCGQMEVLDKHIVLRRKMNDFYKNIFSSIKGVTVLEEQNSDYYSNHWLSAILINPLETKGITREDLRLAFEKENIESRPLWKPMHLQPVFENFPFYGTNVSEMLFQNGLCLPSGSNLTEEDRKRIEKVISKTFK